MIKKIIAEYYLIVVFLIFYFFITAYKFINYPTPFYDWDESIYAQVGREMVEQKSLIPLWQGKFWLDKPPLAPLAYGLVESIAPIPAELSTRLFTLFLSIVILLLIYLVYYQLTKNVYISLFTVVITSFTPVFLQRAQVLNVDIFLFLGWLGYVLFYHNFWLSLLFLSIGVLSKSLLGFYPIFILGMVSIIQLLMKKIKESDFKQLMKNFLIQIFIVSLWYLVMVLCFKTEFIKAHFWESHIKRVTASIESHFGKRTFYFDVLFDQLQIFILPSLIGFVYLLKEFVKKKDLLEIIKLLFFVPWFFFLNLTKTKIHWYIYPVLSQFAFLASYPLKIFKKSWVSIIIMLTLVGIIFNRNLFNRSFFNTHYSTFDQYYDLAIFAKENCRNMTVLIDPESRKTHDELKKMNLLISTSEWWGNHPSIVYYYEKKLIFEYNPDNPIKTDCLAINEKDRYLNSVRPYKTRKQFKEYLLLKYEKNIK